MVREVWEPRLVAEYESQRNKSYVHVTVHRNKFLYNKTNQMHQSLKSIPA